MNDTELRDQFAMSALPAVMAMGVQMASLAAQSGQEHEAKLVDPEQWAKTAYHVADEMMKARAV